MAPSPKFLKDVTEIVQYKKQMNKQYGKNFTYEIRKIVWCIIYLKMKDYTPSDLIDLLQEVYTCAQINQMQGKYNPAWDPITYHPFSKDFKGNKDKAQLYLDNKVELWWNCIDTHQIPKLKIELKKL